MKLVKAYTSLFEELFQSGAEDRDTIRELRYIFSNLTRSALLIHCRLDTELVSLCLTFFELAKGCLILPIIPSHIADGEKNMLEWFEVSIFFWDQLATVVILCCK